MCEQSKLCKNKNAFIVNARLREAQIMSCGVHLTCAIRQMYVFDDERYKRRFDSLVTVGVIPE